MNYLHTVDSLYETLGARFSSPLSSFIWQTHRRNKNLRICKLWGMKAWKVYTFIYFISRRIDETDYYRHGYYVNTLARAPPFVIGMVFGYLLHLYRGKSVQWPKVSKAVKVILAFCSLIIHELLKQYQWNEINENLASYIETELKIQLGNFEGFLNFKLFLFFSASCFLRNELCICEKFCQQFMHNINTKRVQKI